MWKKNRYKPLSNDKAIKLISEIKSFIPEWVRIQRIQRDIPAQLIEAGVDKSNLRQFVETELIKKGIKCRCIRCREIGQQSKKNKILIDESSIELDLKDYSASGGDEIFISIIIKENDLLIGYLRLRDIVYSHRYELMRKPCMIIRELKVLGRELPLGERNKEGWQHRGFGKELLREAERICNEEYDKNHIFVLSGIGVKEYYRKNGYVDDGVYLRKDL
jgi:elongator complex protein 3